MKRVTIVNTESGDLRDMAIMPGTTSAEVLSQIGRPPDDILSSGRGAEPYGADESVYENISDGTKLYASTPVTVGRAN